MSDSIEIMQIAASLECIYTALCDSCGAQVDDNRSESQFSKDLHNKGWRVIDEEGFLCPRCVDVITKPKPENEFN